MNQTGTTAEGPVGRNGDLFYLHSDHTKHKYNKSKMNHTRTIAEGQPGLNGNIHIYIHSFPTP